MNRCTLFALLSALSLLGGCELRPVAHMRPQHCADSDNVAVFSEANNLMAMQPHCGVSQNPEP